MTPTRQLRPYEYNELLVSSCYPPQEGHPTSELNLHILPLAWLQ